MEPGIDFFDKTPAQPSGATFLAVPPTLRLAPPEHGWIDLFIGENARQTELWRLALAARARALDRLGLGWG